MRASWRFAHRNLVGRPTRTILLVLAITLAAALVAAATAALSTLQASFDTSIARAIGEADARVVHRYGEPFERSVLDTVRAWEDVEDATGGLAGSLTLTNNAQHNDDGAVLRSTVQARGVDPVRDQSFKELEMREGRRIERDGELVIDPATALALRAKTGDMLRVQRFGAPMELLVVGVYKRPSLGALQRPLAYLSLPTLEDAIKRTGRITTLAIRLKEGTDVTAWCAARQGVLRDSLLLEPAERVRTGIDRQRVATRLATWIGTIIGMLACAAIVTVGMTTALLEQLREMGIARSIGASRMQLAGGQLLSGLALGIAGSTLGTPLGLALAWLLAWWFRNDLRSPFACSLGGISMAVGGAICAGVAGALFPAIYAARISPLEAISIRARAPSTRGLLLVSVLGLGCLGLQLTFLAPESRDTRFWLYAFLGLPLLFCGWFLLSVPTTLLISRLLSKLIERVLFIPRGLLRGNVQRVPYRLGFTAGALMVAIAELVSTQSNGGAIIDNLRERVKFADGFVLCTNGLSPEEQARIAAIEGISSALPIGYLPLKVLDQQVFGVKGIGPESVVCVGFEPRAFLEMNKLDWIQGAPETAIPRLEAGDAILVAPEFLRARGLGLGSHIRLGGGKSAHDFEIVGVVTAAGLDLATQVYGLRSVYMEQAVSCVFMDMRAVAEKYDTRSAYMMQLKLLDGATLEDEARIDRAVADAVAGAVFTSGRAIKGFVEEIGGAALGLSLAVAFAALLLASCGVGSVVAAGIQSRAREFGVLRSIGASPALLVRLVLAETFLVALAAITAGTLLGLQLAWMGTRFYYDFAGLELPLYAPWKPLALGSGVLLLIALLAAFPAAWRLMKRPVRELLA